MTPASLPMVLLGAALTLTAFSIGLLLRRIDTMPKPPSTPDELENTRLATEGYVVAPPGAPVQAAPRSIAHAPARINAPDREPEFTVPGYEARPMECAACGSTWFETAHVLVTGPRRAERMPGASPLYKCLNCGGLYQEVTANTFEPLHFENGRLVRG